MSLEVRRYFRATREEKRKTQRKKERGRERERVWWLLDHQTGARKYRRNQAAVRLRRGGKKRESFGREVGERRARKSERAGEREGKSGKGGIKEEFCMSDYLESGGEGGDPPLAPPIFSPFVTCGTLAADRRTLLGDLSVANKRNEQRRI